MTCLLPVFLSFSLFAASVDGTALRQPMELSTSNYSLCHEDEFSCKDFKFCIKRKWLCDGKEDCPDGSDEWNCTSKAEKCSTDEFECKTAIKEEGKRCIESFLRCDGSNDCQDNSDEEDCEDYHNGWHGKPDVLDSSIVCRRGIELPCISKENHTEICLSINHYCDGTAHCVNSTDEGGLCDKDQCFHSKCLGQCHNVPEGYLCSCPEPFRLAMDGLGCVGGQICEEWGICSQKCVPISNGHQCRCEDGYMLEKDGYTCRSTDKTTPYLIFSSRNEIKAINLETFKGKSLISGLKNTVALDFYHSPAEDLIFWTDVIDDKIYRGNVINNTLTNIQVVVQTGLLTAEGLAVDWVGRNLYWVESNLDQIEVATLNGSFRRSLIAGDMESPRAIALDPRDGLMFWTDWDRNSPRIESASMSGEDRKTIFRVHETNGAWPNGLTVDFVSRRIYWIDARSDSIHTTSYNGNNHLVVLRGHELLFHPFAITLLDNYVYWTDWRKHAVIRANKWNGTDVTLVQRSSLQPFDVQIFHPSRQPRATEINPCSINNGGCSHLCLLHTNNTHRCQCPHLMRIDLDMKTCLNYDKVLVISKGNDIRGFDVEHPYYHMIPPISLSRVFEANQIDFHGATLTLYWVDGKLNEVKSFQLNGNHNVNSLIDAVINRPRGIAVDWISNNLFLTSQGNDGQAKIYVCNLQGEYISEIINSNLTSPRFLAVNPLEGKIFWSDDGITPITHIKHEFSVDPTISMANMDGSNEEILVSTKNDPDLSRPASLTLDLSANRLYWVNTGKGSIKWLDLKNRSIHTIWNDTSAKKLEPHALAINGEEVIFSSESENSLYVINKTYGSAPRLLRNQTHKVLNLKIFDPKTQYGTNLCAQNNGNCSHLCLPVSSSKRVCKCVVGFNADPKDDTKCEGQKKFLVFSWNHGLNGISLDVENQNETVFPSIPKVLLANDIDFSYSRQTLYYVDSEEGSIRQIRTDTTHHQVIINKLEYIQSLAVDWIAENLYWIESYYGVIEVARLNGTFRTVILSGIENSNKIRVHPLKGFIFWSGIDSNKQVRLERALMDGTERQNIYPDSPLTSSSILNRIEDFTIDFTLDRLYLIDSRTRSIQRMDLDGGNQEILLTYSDSSSPISLAVNSEYLYWIDNLHLRGSISKSHVDEIQNKSLHVVLTENLGDHVKDIEVYYQQPRSTENPCSVANGQCQELCFFVGNKTHRCACAHGLLANDSKSCKRYDAFVAFSRIHSIETIPIDEESTLKQPYPPIQNETIMRNVIGLTFDYDSKRIFYSDIQQGSINSVFFDGTEHRLVMEKQGSVEGISFDRYTQELWWTSNSDASINKLNVIIGKFPHKVIKLGTADKLRGIAVHGCKAYVFWANWNSQKPSIQRAFTSGAKIESIIETDIRMPNAITIDHQLQRLYWSDARLDKIEVCDFDGKNRLELLKGTPQHPFDLAVYGDFIFWTDWVAHGVYRANKYNGEDLIMVRKNIPRPMGIVAIAADAEDCQLNPCNHINGGCSDVCEVSTNGTVECSCFDGRTLTSDGQRCMNNVTHAKCDAKQFQCGDGFCIPYDLTCNGINNCKDRSDEEVNFCAERSCPEGFYSCVNGLCIEQEKVCDKYIDCPDRADEKNCTCSADQFKCLDGLCIPASHRCDKEPDCHDISDEINCPPTNCSIHPPIIGLPRQEKFIPCARTTLCISPSWVCDTHNDCLDGSDEENCTAKTPLEANSTEICGPNQFKCDSGQCIQLKWRCDMDPDCEGENQTITSDEMNCNYTCATNQFECARPNGLVRCIPTIWTCDGHKDCDDGSDEAKSICVNKECAPNLFKCASGQCIPYEWVCDGDVDCPNGDSSDEFPPRGCPSRVCKQEEWQCRNYQCILSKFYCDGDDDCGDESDEASNCAHGTCFKNQFECKDKKCIPQLWTCNGIPDCADSSDEDPVLCANNKTTSSCNSTLFECRNKACVEPSVLCDGRNNCGDYSDEEDCGKNECQFGSDCAQICEDMVIGYKCSCNKGFESLDGGKICKDINECEKERPCSQFCKNSYGSYSCFCDKGYKAFNNGSSCRSTSPIEPYILFSERHNIVFADLKGHSLKLKAQNLSKAVAVDFDWESHCLFWSEVSRTDSSIRKACYTNYSSSDGEEPMRIQSHVVKSPDGLAVDWVAKNLYWTDMVRETIQVSRFDGRFRKVLVKTNLQEPRAIALDPSEGFMYWTDWGNTPYIGKAGMDGSNPIVLINTSLGWPNALTIDYISKEIFWADAKEDYISVSKTDGSNRAIVVNSANSQHVGHIFAITVFEDFLYWTDWSKKVVAKCHKHHCTNSSRIIQVSEKPMDIHIMHPFRQPPFPNPCNANSCQALCLLKPGKNGAESVCTCPEDFVLAEDNSSCMNNCSRDHFLCPNTLKCIPAEWFCDNQDDCGDRFDEPSQCLLPKCKHPGYFPCTTDNLLNSSKCIPAKSYCDGKTDCADGSDELCTAINPNSTEVCGKDWCLNGGKCSAPNGSCVCAGGYSGKRCEFMFCKCKNGGTCGKSMDKKICICPPGYSGPLCDNIIEPVCHNFFCENGGYCQAKVGKPFCVCPQGWEGENCEKLVKQLNCKDYCLNGGICNENQNHPRFTCSCPHGFTGDRCEMLGNLSGPPRAFSGSDLRILVIVISSAAVVFIILLVLRFRLRNRAFMHRRIDDFAVNMEITNPMFGEDGDGDEDGYSSETPTQAFPLKSENKSTNFANPLYEFEEEKTNLLSDGNEILPRENLIKGESAAENVKAET